MLPVMSGLVNDSSGWVLSIRTFILLFTFCCLSRQNFVVAPTTSDIISDIRSTSANAGAEYQLQPAELQDYEPTEHAELGEVWPAADMDTLSQAIETER